MKIKWIALFLLVLLLCLVVEYIYIHKPQEVRVDHNINIVEPLSEPEADIYKIPGENKEYTNSTSQILSDHLSNNSNVNGSDDEKSSSSLSKDRRTTQKVKEGIIKDQYFNVRKEITF